MKNSDIAEAFRAAKTKLAATRDEWRTGNKHEFICHAIRANTPGGSAAIKIINDRLNCCGTVTSWVITYAPGAKDLANEDPIGFDNEVQIYRHRWLDALIKEFSK